ncbi:flagellar biosynthetic protein FliR [Kangiella sp. HZ709]|uniref:flagellar biosynthetic protein FliR n=1 Tax=Kangiella sp. HZ709 TaxID=2666328 RepID=UPI0012B0CBB2|nr:flagellar biosynthetic protein FliR [Kangiella sp. HZ709]MRX26861.1 hypothetical protein [Kangiella sp. HZ709]
MVDNLILQQAFLGFLIFVRISALFLTAQSLLGRVPNVVRLYLCIVLSITIFIYAEVPVDLPSSVTGLIAVLLLESILGATLAFGIICLFAALSFVGRALDLQIGFGAANIIDPTTSNSEALLGTIFTTLAITLFFILDVHGLFIKGISESFSLVPFGSLPETITSSKILSYLSSQFLFGLSLILPTMIGLLALDLVIAYTSKSMPQMNIYFVSLPLKIGAGIFLLFLTIPASGNVFKNMFNAVNSFWNDVLGVA